MGMIVFVTTQRLTLHTHTLCCVSCIFWFAWIICHCRLCMLSLLLHESVWCAFVYVRQWQARSDFFAGIRLASTRAQAFNYN